MRRIRSATAKATATASAAALVLLATAACSPVADVEPAPSPSAAAPTPTARPTTPAETGPVETTGDPRVVATDLELPWSLVALASGSFLVSERDTALVKEVRADGTVREVGRVADVQPGGEGGQLGLAVQSDDESWLYAFTTTGSDNRIVRMPLTGAAGSYALGAAETVFDGLPKAGNHNGGRIKFGPDGMLYATAGDAGSPDRSQDPDSLGGKILRMTPDGSIPSDNPFPGSAVYSLGHRNPQGIAWDADGQLWAAEFGQNTWDEFNRIVPGGNYGWPVIEGIGEDADYIDPVSQWSTSEASPSGLLHTRDTFFLAALRGERLWSIYTDPASSEPGSAETVASFTGDFGRLRDVVEGPGDTLWILTNNTGRSPREGDDKILEVQLAPRGEG